MTYFFNLLRTFPARFHAFMTMRDLGYMVLHAETRSPHQLRVLRNKGYRNASELYILGLLANPCFGEKDADALAQFLIAQDCLTHDGREVFSLSYPFAVDALIHHPKLPETALLSLLQAFSGAPRLLIHVAESFPLTPELAETLLRSQHSQVLQALAQNKTAPQDIRVTAALCA